ncbi:MULTISPECIES: acyltransferase domain-containing protein [unclassified Bradyrhizobium]|uniref:acyltransferase domain-containing protein n=1 Tax=unclassified Bradyrhizobium TaxID=2631580 RepID=UPI002111F232|nr:MULTISPECIES: acyltransferase domain-containing protein [unclassified Bradyrhizobium]MCK1296805.1 acyltransferase domain-containing protein [Bradyrhizobium sp. 37]MCK1769041.1 acyltransferase domain-containing protein [Bradyrhizobium sp. 134]
MLALLCGGQGTLSDKIFDLVAEQPAAASIFAAAAPCLGEDPREFVRTRPAEQLSENRASQILTVTSALATHACIADLLTEETAVAGYSVGEMAAWSIAGIWAADEALRLTDIRARMMQSAAGPDGRLGYVRGLDRAALEPLLAKHRCEIAIKNPDLLFVIGGTEEDVSALCDEAAREGARTGLLAVKIASHTTRLAQACKPLQQALDASRHAVIAAQRILLAGGEGERIFSFAGASAKLARQVAHPIDWAATLDALAELGVTRVLDLGPGHALAEMVRASQPSIRCYAADGFRTLGGLRNWIAAA